MVIKNYNELIAEGNFLQNGFLRAEGMECNQCRNCASLIFMSLRLVRRTVLKAYFTYYIL